MFASRNVTRKPSIDKESLVIVTHAFGSLINRFKCFYSLIIDFKLNILSFLVNKDCNWMFASRNVKRKPSIDKKSSFIVTHSFESVIIGFKWIYNLIIDFKFNFLRILVKTKYNWMFASRNVTRKPSICKESLVIVTHAFGSLINRFKSFYSLIIDFKLNILIFLVKTDYNWMLASGNVKRKPSIDKKSSFIVTHSFESVIIGFKWIYNLIMDFKFNILIILVKTEYNWMFTSRNVRLKPSVERKSPFIVTHTFKSLITRFK